MSVDLAPTVVASWDKLAGESSVCVCVWLLVASVYLQTMSSACSQQVLMWLFTPSRHKNRQEFVAPIVLMSTVLCGHVGQQLHLSVAADYLLIPPAGLSADRQEKNQKSESALHSLLELLQLTGCSAGWCFKPSHRPSLYSGDLSSPIISCHIQKEITSIMRSELTAHRRCKRSTIGSSSPLVVPWCGKIWRQWHFH